MEDDGVIEIEDQNEQEFEYEKGEEEEQEEEEQEGSEDDDDDAYEEEEELIPAVVPSPRVSNLVSRSGNSQEAVVDNLADMQSSNKNLASQENGRDDGDREEELNGGEIDGLFCPICMDAWTSGGSHQIWYDHV